MIIAECGPDYSSHMLSVNWQNNYTLGLMALPKRKSERGQNDCFGCVRNSDRVRWASCWGIRNISNACECSLLWVVCTTSPDKGGNLLAENEVSYWWAYIRWKTLLWSLESGSWMSLRMWEIQGEDDMDFLVRRRHEAKTKEWLGIRASLFFFVLFFSELKLALIFLGACSQK